MKTKRKITKKLMVHLHREEQQDIVRSVVIHIYPDLPPDQLNSKIVFWEPRIINGISAGDYGIWLVIFQHIKRLSPAWLLDCWLDGRVTSTGSYL